MLLSVALHANHCFFLFVIRTSDRQTQQRQAFGWRTSLSSAPHWGLVVHACGLKVDESIRTRPHRTKIPFGRFFQ